MRQDQYLRFGFYLKGIFELVSDAELRDPAFVREMRKYGASLHVPYEAMQDWITTFYACAPIVFRDENYRETYVETRHFEAPNFHFWVRDFCTPVPAGVRPRVRREAWERTRAFTSLLRAHRALSTR